MLDWVLANKEWMFSGIDITIITAMYYVLNRRKKKFSIFEKTRSIGKIIANGNVSVNQAIKKQITNDGQLATHIVNNHYDYLPKIGIIIISGLIGILITILTITTYPDLLVGWGLKKRIGNQSVKAEILRHRPSEPLYEELGNAEIVWFSWVTGSTQAMGSDWKVGSRKYKAILTNPHSTAMDALSKMTPNEKNGGKTARIGAIEQFSCDLMKYGADLRWFDGAMQNSLTIVNPDSENAWARIELQLPFEIAALRPSIKVNKKDDPKFFQQIKDTFLRIWDNSHSSECLDETR